MPAIPANHSASEPDTGSNKMPLMAMTQAKVTVRKVPPSRKAKRRHCESISMHTQALVKAITV